MELKNNEDLKLFFRDTIHEQWTNVTAIAKKANVSQPSLQNFVKGKKEKAISTYTMFPVLKALGKKLIAIDSDTERYQHKTIVVDTERLFADMGANKEEIIEQALLDMQKQPWVNIPKVTKESLSSELRSRIEEYKSAPEPKEKFSVDLIIEFLEESYDKLATI